MNRLVSKLSYTLTLVKLIKLLPPKNFDILGILVWENLDIDFVCGKWIVKHKECVVNRADERCLRVRFWWRFLLVWRCRWCSSRGIFLVFRLLSWWNEMNVWATLRTLSLQLKFQILYFFLKFLKLPNHCYKSKVKFCYRWQIICTSKLVLSVLLIRLVATTTAVRTCALNRYNNDNFGMADIYD